MKGAGEWRRSVAPSTIRISETEGTAEKTAGKIQKKIVMTLRRSTEKWTCGTFGGARLERAAGSENQRGRCRCWL